MAIRLISTDFDGTLVFEGSPEPFDPLLLDILATLQEQGVLWAVNTGRTVRQLEEGLENCRFYTQPDFILTCERDIYRRSHKGWVDVGDWNARCASDHQELWRELRPLWEQIDAMLKHQPQTRLIRHGSDPVGLIAATEEDMDMIVERLARHRQEYPLFGFQRNNIYLRFCHASYDKGTALAELARQLAIPREEVYAVGDNHNDLPMLDGRAAAMVACPGNSVPEVVQTVRRADGYVAKQAGSRGVMESLFHFQPQLRDLLPVG